jgi:hypothetical protein
MIMATHSQAPGDFEPRWNRTEREHSNRRASTLCGLATTLATFPILIMPPAAQAEESSCSLSRAAANWTFTDSGTVIGVGARAALGKFTLNAAGSLLNGVATSSLNGAIAEETFYGTYTVKSDCTGTMTGEIFSGDTELFAVTLSIIFDKKMEHLHGLFTSIVTPGGASRPSVIALDGRRE